MGTLEAILSVLWVLTPLTATVSVFAVLVAIVTNQWLHTEEKMNNPSYNGTGEKDYLSKMTVSGLWMLCFTNREYMRVHFPLLLLLVRGFSLLYRNLDK